MRGMRSGTGQRAAEIMRMFRLTVSLAHAPASPVNPERRKQQNEMNSCGGSNTQMTSDNRFFCANYK